MSQDILGKEGNGINARSRADSEHTQLCIFLNGLLLSNLEALGLGGSEIIFVVVGHCDGCSWVGGVSG